MIRWFRFILLFVFVCSDIGPLAYAQDTLDLPITGVSLSSSFAPALIKGIKIHPEDPFRFDFVVDVGNRKLKGEEFKEESKRLVKYFLACLTIPEKDLWVNLSPYEKDRVIVPTSDGISGSTTKTTGMRLTSPGPSVCC